MAWKEVLPIMTTTLQAALLVSAGCASTLLVVAHGPARPAAQADDLYAPVAHLISDEGFAQLAPVHRKMLIRLASHPPDAPVAFCFTPGTGWELRRAFYNAVWGAVPGEGGPRFQLSNRWTRTATDGYVGSTLGRPLTLTYSFAPDGTLVPGYGAPAGPSNLFSVFDALYPTTEAWQNQFHQMFARWSEVTGIIFVHEPNDDGASYSSSNRGVLGLRGDIRIAGHYLDGQVGANILAFNYYPNYGDMVIDTANTAYYGNAYLLRSTTAHEVGHGIGLRHVCPEDSTKLMEPTANGLDGAAHDDIQGAQRFYGDHLEDNDDLASAAHLGTLGTGTHTFAELSADDNGDTDFYGFAVVGQNRLAVTLRPVGWTYLQGPETELCDSGDPYDSLTVSDLDLELRDTDGTTVLALADDYPAGLEETIGEMLLPSGPGTYYLRVFAGNANNVQLYDLDLAVVNLDCNGNGVDNAGDIAAGTSNDCNENGLPDECEIDQFSSAPGGPFFCTAGCDPDLNDNGLPDACDDCNDNGVIDGFESPALLFFNLGAALGVLETAAPVAQDVHLGGVGDALLSGFNVYYHSTGSTPGSLTVRLWRNDLLDGTLPGDPGGLIAEYSLGQLAYRPVSGPFGSTDRQIDPYLAVPHNLWIEVQVTQQAGVVLRAGPTDYGFTHGRVYDRDTQQFRPGGPHLMGLRLLGVRCPSDCNQNGVPDQDETDTDGDNLIDDCDQCPADDQVITVAPEAQAAGNCADSVDNDCDGQTDAADPDCPASLCTCGDLDAGGGPVDLNDFAVFANCYGLASPTPDCPAPQLACSDLDLDGAVNLNDFATFATLFGLVSTSGPPDCTP